MLEKLLSDQMMDMIVGVIMVITVVIGVGVLVWLGGLFLVNILPNDPNATPVPGIDVPIIYQDGGTTCYIIYDEISCVR